MKKYNAVIFDLDGVICHTDKYHYQAWKAVADELGIYFDEEINNRLRGVSRMESFEIILERYEGEMSEEEKECWTTKKNDIYKELLKNMSPADLSAVLLLRLLQPNTYQPVRLHTLLLSQILPDPALILKYYFRLKLHQNTLQVPTARE